MKLVEVIILAGTHCISPLQHADGVTDAAKVSCAVIVEKDTEARTISVMPPWQSAAPEVVAALADARSSLPGARIAAAPALRIEPAAARPEPILPPAPALPAAVAPPVPAEPAANPEVDSANRSAGAVSPPADEQPQGESVADTSDNQNVKAQEKPTVLAETEAPAELAAAESAKPVRAARAPSGQCAGGAKPAWYTNKDGRRKYRCVMPGKVKLY